MSTQKTDKTSDNKASSQETVTIPPSQEEAGQFRQAYEGTADERNALGEDQLAHINVDIPTAVNIVLGNLPNIEALADEAKALNARLEHWRFAIPAARATAIETERIALAPRFALLGVPSNSSISASTAICSVASMPSSRGPMNASATSW